MSLPIHLDIYPASVATQQQGNTYFGTFRAMKDDEANAVWPDLSQTVGVRNVTEEWKRAMVTLNAAGDSSVIIPADAGGDVVPKTSYLHGIVPPHNSTPLDAAGDDKGMLLEEVISTPESSIQDMLLSATWWTAVYCTSLVILWMLLCEIWRQWNLRATHDPASGLSHLPLPPGDFGLPLLGETLAWLTQGGNFNASRRQKHGNVFKTNVIGIPMIRVTGHDLVKQVLGGEHDKVTTIWPVTIRRLIGTHTLANTTGAEHCHKRKIAVKAFTRSALNGYIPGVRESVVKSLQEMKNLEELKVYSQMKRLTFKTALSALAGIHVKSDEEFEDIYTTFVNLVENILSMPIDLPFSGFNKGLKARKRMLNLLHPHIVERRQKLEKFVQSGGDEDSNEFCDALSIMQLEDLKYQERRRRNANNNNHVGAKEEFQQNVPNSEPDYTLSDFAVKEMIIEILFGGFATTASMLTSVMLEVSRHPEVFRNIEEELLRHGHMREGAPSDVEEEEPFQELDLSEIHRLQYLDQVVREILRVHPPILGGYRKAKKTFELGGYRIPKGMTLVYSIRDTHHFESGGLSDFDPDRFSQKMDRENKFKYLPFGGGPRVCVGQEYARMLGKVTMVELIRHFEGWELTDKNPPTMRTIPNLRPVGGMPVKMHRRKNPGYA